MLQRLSGELRHSSPSDHKVPQLPAIVKQGGAGTFIHPAAVSSPFPMMLVETIMTKGSIYQEDNNSKCLCIKLIELQNRVNNRMK